MNRIAIGVAMVMLLGFFAFTSYASYSGLGLVTSNTYQTNEDGTTTTTGSGVRSVFFPVFIGGGPGSGK